MLGIRHCVLGLRSHDANLVPESPDRAAPPGGDATRPGTKDCADSRLQLRPGWGTMRRYGRGAFQPFG